MVLLRSPCSQHTKLYQHPFTLWLQKSHCLGYWCALFSPVQQWRNGQGGSVPPRDLWQEIFADLPGKKREGKMEKGRKWRRKEGKGKVENWKWKEGKVWKWEEDFFFFFFFLLFTFQNNNNLFWGYQHVNFLPGKSISGQEENQEKSLCPFRKCSCYVPAVQDAVCVVVVNLMEDIKFWQEISISKTKDIHMTAKPKLRLESKEIDSSLYINRLPWTSFQNQYWAVSIHILTGTF